MFFTYEAKSECPYMHGNRNSMRIILSTVNKVFRQHAHTYWFWITMVTRTRRSEFGKIFFQQNIRY